MPDLDVEHINGLLDIVLRTKDFPTLNAINQAAMSELLEKNVALEDQQVSAKREAQRREAEAVADRQAKQRAKEKVNAA
jgi:hypothetical protein